MSLNSQQVSNTINELHENFVRSGLSKQQVADDLHISLIKLEKLFTLTQSSLNDPWILRNYLIQKVEENGKVPVTFTALVGNWHQYWFLNSRVIDQRQMSAGDN
ncbi:DUF2316 family protein [Pediococcus ethanolidurans]|uniref:DUF2316 family protein n=1 Tax=Pediococcus ethanolidurans TaxID=319653 RepID=UPI0029532D7C|nr:DUF2316 family protein [Pediococcus ethanolidurans]MDV7719334.1 DUF2316 family protein [Pediococcus ethanolidurans]